MRRPLFILRPEPGWSATAQAARSLGIEVAGHPLFEIEPVAWTPPDASRFEALLAGSANAFRHGGEPLDALSSLPVLAVGAATAAAARAAGFLVAMTGEGGLQALLDGLEAKPARFLRLAGEHRVPLRPPSGTTIDEVVVYRSRAVRIDSRMQAALAKGGVVALHSGRAARHFRAETARLGIDRARLALVALACRIAHEAGEAWRSVDIAGAPTDTGLLALAKGLCNNGEQGSRVRHAMPDQGRGTDANG